MNWMVHLQKGMAVIGLLFVEMPRVMADGKLTISELVEIFTAICQICGWSVEYKIPPKVKDVIIGATDQGKAGQDAV